MPIQVLVLEPWNYCVLSKDSVIYFESITISLYLSYRKKRTSLARMLRKHEDLGLWPGSDGLNIYKSAIHFFDVVCLLASPVLCDIRFSQGFIKIVLFTLIVALATFFCPKLYFSITSSKPILWVSKILSFKKVFFSLLLILDNISLLSSTNARLSFVHCLWYKEAQAYKIQIAIHIWYNN